MSLGILSEQVYGGPIQALSERTIRASGIRARPRTHTMCYQSCPRRNGGDAVGAASQGDVQAMPCQARFLRHAKSSVAWAGSVLGCVEAMALERRTRSVLEAKKAVA